MSTTPVQELSAAFRDLAQAFDLIEIKPVGFLARMVKDAPKSGAGIVVDIKPTLATSLDGTRANGFLVRGDFAISAHQGSEQENTFLKLRYTILGRYAVPEAFPHPLDAPLRMEFAGTNAMIHLWPYLRTFVSGTCAQFGIPLITIPVFRPGMIQQVSSSVDE
ncbi:hypothetical protein G4177_03085 [Corallococcus sp. ZKHCc1 1396]|uniref:Preprotein translocase subunit SecB n=1 Tax=Corallococcus soli TaxID=2710757 RepID=A0ABR9PH15_9BACT|nr:hypothetical protein [Corallococcus soli]MBE4747159.1 hypothetical protein [Corallococcus soli]